MLFTYRKGLLVVENINERLESLHDSLVLLKNSIEKINPVQLKKPPSCSEAGLDWPTGKKIYE